MTKTPKDTGIKSRVGIVVRVFGYQFKVRWFKSRRSQENLNEKTNDKIHKKSKFFKYTAENDQVF